MEGEGEVLSKIGGRGSRARIYGWWKKGWRGRRKEGRKGARKGERIA